MTYYHQGWAAYVNGLPETACPYADNMKRGAWLSGWRSASQRAMAS